MDNIIKTSGTTEQYKLNPGGSISYPFAVKGIVKQNVDSIRTGRIKVYIADFGATDPNDSSSWVVVSYLSPFYGFLPGDYAPNTASDSSYGTFLENPTSYGFWATSPDIGSEVVCLFLYGKKDFGYYIGCIPQPGITHMVPAIGSTNDVIMEEAEAEKFGGSSNLPTVEMNVQNNQLYNTPTFYDQAKPVHKIVAAQLWQQGLLRDSVRGTITSSSTRESPSQVFGISTPGRPIYKGITGGSEGELGKNVDSGTAEQAKLIGRRGGHTFVLDDGDFFGQNNLIRLRSASGHQITMSDDGQTLFIIHSNGQSYIELGKEGTVDIYATNSINVRTKGDLNLHADNNININAKKKFNIFAEELNINSDKNTNLRVGENFSQQTLKNHTVKVDEAMSFLSKSTSSFKSDAVTYINGSKINLNTGSSPTVPAEIKPIPVVQHTDTFFDETQGWVPAPAKLPSINSRVPAHTPWTDANKGVDVKIDDSAAGNFPSPPSPAVQNTNAATANVPVKVTTPAVASTVPSSKSAKGNFDKNTTSAAVSQAAVSAGTDPVKGSAALAGGGIVTNNGSKTAVLGKLGHSPNQLEEAGVLKPGASTVANNLIQNNKSLDQSIPPNLLTGKDGINNINDYNKSSTAQTSTQVNLMNSSYNQLKSNGIIQGNESPTQITGLVNSTSSYGIGPVKSYVNGASGSNTTPSAQSNNGAIASTISSGNYAANMAEKLLSPVGSMVSSVISTGAAIGAAVVGAASAVFNAIKGSYTKLTAGKPQNLSALNSKNSQNGGNAVGGLYGGDNAISNNVSSSYFTSPTTVNPSQITQSVDASTNGLVNATVSNVPSDELASLQSASKSISSNGPAATKMPTAAVNTVDRSSIKSATTEIYSDKRISLPYSDSAESKPPKAEVLEQYNDLRGELDVAVNNRRQNKIKWKEAVSTYGGESVQAVTALRDYKDSIREVESLETAVELAYKELYG
jgi:hypothetical protein